MTYFLLLTFCIIQLAYGDENVKYAAIIFRHGDRTPVDPYPNDPWRNESYWPVKFGELTNNGKRQHFKFGKWLRQRYSHLLSRDFDPTEIYIRSTDVDRTLMSAQANLAGLYPPYGKTIWNSDVMWQPIPVHTVPTNEDEILAMEKPCTVYNRELENFKNSTSYIQGLHKYKKLMDYLTIHSGRKVKSYYDIENIYNTLYVESLYNFTLPDWTHAVYPDKMQEPACYSFTTDTATPLLARLKVGPLLKHITTNMITATSSNSGKHLKVQLYSAHDLTVGCILNGLGLFDGKCPCYTSAVFLELLIDNSISSHYVRISYRNNTDVAEPYILEIPNCGKKCPLNKFIKLYDNLLSVNWESECNNEFTPRLAASFLVGVFILACIYVAHKIHFVRVYKRNRKVRGYANIVTAELQVTQIKTVNV